MVSLILKPLPELAGCELCPRLVQTRRELSDRYPGYWNRPVSMSGPEKARILIIGLVPGLHGANRTGQPFVYRRSLGDLLFSCLREAGLKTSQYRITNAVKCWPPGNRPLAAGVHTCNRFLQQEVLSLVGRGKGQVPQGFARFGNCRPPGCLQSHGRKIDLLPQRELFPV